MYRSIPQSTSNLRVFNACLLSFMILIAPIASVAAATLRATTPFRAITRTKRQPVTTEDLESSLFEPKTTAAAMPVTSSLPAPFPAAAPAPPPVGPVITASKVDSFTDAEGDGADLGQAITYTVNVNNSAAGPDATTVVFADTIDPNTTFVPGSVIASAVAVNDTYPQTVIGNVAINSANIPYSVVSNDFLGINPTATISAFDSSLITHPPGLRALTLLPIRSVTREVTLAPR
jgi:uncharacterized repeat protein (TIGR01451 family)